MRRFFQLCFLVVAIASSCKRHDKIPDTYITRFRANEPVLSKLIETLRKDSTFEKFPEIEGGLEPQLFGKSVRTQLNELGILNVYIFSWGASRGIRQRQFNLTTNWRAENPIHITFNSLDSIETVKGFYRKDENANEIWGLGNHWSLWIERKLIQVDR